MNDATASHSAEIAALTRAYAALSRGDVDAFVQDFHPQIERIEWEGLPSERAYHGIAAVRAHVVEGRGTWAEGSCTPERFVIAGDKVVVLVKVHVRLKDKPDWIDGTVGDVFTFRGGKVISFRSFMTLDEAMTWAGDS